MDNSLTVIAKKHSITLISVVITLIIGIFYFNQQLYVINNANDFGEYFLRAEFWSEGILHWRGGSDKLLSLIEYIAIQISGHHDFQTIYDNINNIITLLMLLAIFAFLINKNPLAPEFHVRALTILFVFTLPAFILKGRVGDQTYLFGIMLLLWVSTYHILILSSIISVLTFLARPEAIIIIPLFFLVFFLDKHQRKKIIVNFVVFLLLLLAYKSFDHSLSTQVYREIQMIKSAGILDLTNQEMYILALVNFIKIPLHYLIIALLILKSYFYLFFFIIGTVVTLRDKHYTFFLAIPLLYLLIYFLLAPTKIHDYAQMKPYLDNIANTTYHVIHSWGIRAPLISQERYIVFLYPFLAIFVVKGILYFGYRIYCIFCDYKVFNGIKIYYIIASIILICLSLVNITQFIQFKREKHLDSFQIQISALNKAGTVIRNKKTSLFNTVIIYDFCDPESGSALSIFEVFSGVINVYTKLCTQPPIPPQIYGYPPELLQPHQVGRIPSDKIDTINAQHNFKFYFAAIDYPFTAKNKEKINALFRRPTVSLLKKYAIDFIISQNRLNLDKLELLGREGDYYIYRFSS